MLFRLTAKLLLATANYKIVTTELELPGSQSSTEQSQKKSREELLTKTCLQ